MIKTKMNTDGIIWIKMVVNMLSWFHMVQWKYPLTVLDFIFGVIFICCQSTNLGVKNLDPMKLRGSNMILRHRLTWKTDSSLHFGGDITDSRRLSASARRRGPEA